MAFVSGLMGPYMRPIPVGASAAMLFSLLVAFIVSPWLSFIVLRKARKPGRATRRRKDLPSTGSTRRSSRRSWRARRKALGRLLGVVVLLLAGHALWFPSSWSRSRCSPSTTRASCRSSSTCPKARRLEKTAALAREMGEYLKTRAGGDGLSDLRRARRRPSTSTAWCATTFCAPGAIVADIQVNFVAKEDRKAQSHDIAKRIRPRTQAIGDRYGARIKVAEIPPGPPVLSTLVAEIYGPDFDPADRDRQRDQRHLRTDRRGGRCGLVRRGRPEEAHLRGRPGEGGRERHQRPKPLSQSVRIALTGTVAGLVHLDKEKEPVEIFLRMPLEDRADLATLASRSTSRRGREARCRWPSW